MSIKEGRIMSVYKTEQEKFWAGNFGDKYISRNNSKKLHASNLTLFGEIFSNTQHVKTTLELGANIGMNISPINNLLPDSKTSAVEINPNAFKQLKTKCTGRAYLSSIFAIGKKMRLKYDFVFTKGVLIHMPPDKLQDVYEVMYKLSKKYICVIEYYNPSPVMLEYRGEKNKLFKRDFAGDLLEKYRNLELIAYGFKYRRDNNYPDDDLNWFLLRK